MQKSKHIIKQLEKDIGYYVPPALQALFKVVKGNFRQIKDNKVLLSVIIHEELCKVADCLFTEYTRKLTKGIFVLAFAFSMRVSEYTDCACKGNLSHNIRANTVQLSPLGVSLEFISDKVSSLSPAVKHRM